MAIDLKNKKILVTGSSDGLGKLLVLELAKLGASVMIHGKDENKVNEVLLEMGGEGEHKSIICDLSKPETVESAFSQINELDILVNNAGLWQEGSITNASPERIIELVNVNLTSYILTSRILIPTIQKSEFGQILNVISSAGFEVPTDYYHSVYSATKYGLQGLSEAMAKEFENKNLRVMGYYPGGMQTQLFNKAGNKYGDEPWMFDPMESVEAMIFMLTRNSKINIKRMDLINQLQK